MSAIAPQGPRPNPLPLRERLMSYVYRAPVFALATAIFASLAVAVSLFEKSGRWQHRIAQAFGVIGSGNAMLLDQARERLIENGRDIAALHPPAGQHLMHNIPLQHEIEPLVRPRRVRL